MRCPLSASRIWRYIEIRTEHLIDSTHYNMVCGCSCVEFKGED